MIHYVLDFIGFILILKWIKLQFKDYKNFQKKSDYFSLKRFQTILITLIIVALPILIVNLTSVEVVNHLSKETIASNKHWYAIVVSFFISFIWLIYVIKLDVFNKEKKRNILFVIILACISTSLAEYPYQFVHRLGLVDSVQPVQSFIYSVFGIGLVEEIIKLIPLLIVLKFTKAIDEPYDYILYASCSALGFAFVENAMYLSDYGLEIINARALYATVAHMTFSSMIAYGLFLVKYKKTKFPAVLVFLAFFFFAIFSHGFYDFWLMNKAVSKFTGLTTLFFLVTVHIWFAMKNNTINVSNYYDKSKIVNNDGLKIYLSIGLLSIFMFSYLYVSFAWNSKQGNLFLIKSALVYGYIIFYLVATLSKFDLIKGFIKPFKLNFRHLIPRKKK